MEKIKQLDILIEDYNMIRGGEIKKTKSIDLEKTPAVDSTSGVDAELIERVQELILQTSNEVYNESLSNNTFSIYCAANVYRNTYKERLTEFINSSQPMVSEETFINSELNLYKYLIDSQNAYLYTEIKTAFKHKIAFLYSKQDSLDSISEPLTEMLDCYATEKIAILHEFGVLDFLKNQEAFKTTTNNLAKYLSLITGEKASTLQSYLNPIFNKHVDQSKNPLSKKEIIDKVKLKISAHGIK